MAASPFSTVANQAASTVKNLAGGVSAGIRAETSITGRAATLAGTAVKKAESRVREAQRRSRDRSGVYILTEEEARAKDSAGGELFVAPDGYIRKTPVQHIVLAPDYRARQVKKIVSGILLAALAVAVVYILARFNVISF